MRRDAAAAADSQDEYDIETRQILALVLGTLACASYSFFFVLLGILYKVSKVVKCPNISISRVIVFLALAVLLRSIYYTVEAHGYASTSDPSLEYSDTTLNVLAGLPVLFFQVTVILNLSNWAYYYVKINELG